MKRIAIIAALALGLTGASVSGCNYAQTTAQINADVTETNNLLANLAGNNVPAACGIIAVAEGYFAELKDHIPADKIAAEAKVEAAIAVICDNPPKNVGEVAGAFVKLTKLWFAVQANTKAS